jgi:hypothetical protein
MRQPGRIWVRGSLAAGASLILLVAGLSAGRPAASASDTSATTTAQVTAAVTAGSFIGAPSMASPVTWCCASSTLSGLTATGQASVHGESTQSRDTAIAQAVTDATDQATTAAKAAGLSLGKIVELQVSASGYSCPYPLEAGAARSTGATVCQPNGCTQSDTGVACPASTPGAPSTLAPISVESFATVTVTWAIG